MIAVRNRVLGGGPEALDLGQADTLVLVCERGSSRMSEVAEAMRVDASTATRAVARLEAAGLVRRAQGIDDRRSVLVLPTEAGLAVFEGIRDRYLSALSQICDGFADAETGALADLLERFVTGLDTIAAD